MGVYYRLQISDAVAWTLIYQIMRRYHTAYDLRLVETHPCCGQYDCLSIVSGHPLGKHISIFDFNVGARSLWIHNDINSRVVQCRFDIVDDYMGRDDPKELLDSICLTAGFKKQSHMPRPTGPVVTIGIMASIIQLYAFSREYLRHNMGYEDTSGYGGGIREALSLFKVSKPLMENNDIRGAYRYFYLENTNKPKHNKHDAKCLFDLSGKVFFRDDSEIELLPAYIKHNRKTNLLATTILTKANL